MEHLLHLAPTPPPPPLRSGCYPIAAIPVSSKDYAAVFGASLAACVENGLGTSVAADREDEDIFELIAFSDPFTDKSFRTSSRKIQSVDLAVGALDAAIKNEMEAGDDGAMTVGARDAARGNPRPAVPSRRRGFAAAMLALTLGAAVALAAYFSMRGSHDRSVPLDGSDASGFMVVHQQQQQALRQPPPPSSTSPTCPDGEYLWTLRLLTDDYPWETRWELHRNSDNDGEVLASGPPEGYNYSRRTRYVGALCVVPGEYFMWWFDARGDGMCCEYGRGEWTVSIDGETVLESDSLDNSFAERDFPFRVGGSAAEVDGDVTGTFLIMPRPRNEMLHHVELADGTVYELLNLPPDFYYADEGLVSGVSSIALPAGTEFLSNGTADVKGEAPRASNAPRSHRQRPNRFVGTKSILAVRVDVSDGAMSLDEASLSNSIFGNGVDRVNMVSQFNACSYGKLNLVKAQDKSGGSSDNVDAEIENGVMTVRLPSVTKAQGHGTMRNAVTRELNAIFGVPNPKSLADYVIYCLPVGTYSPAGADGTGIAYAYINFWLAIFNDKWCESVSLQMHELGHNLNMGHSNEGGEYYEDQAGIMGASYPNSDSPRLCFNAAKSWQTSWYREKSIVINSNGANDRFDGILHGIADYPIATTVLLKVQTRSGNDYFVNFNAKRGINAGTQEGGNQVTIVRRPRGRRDSYAESELVAKLDAGGSYDDLPGYTISVGEIDTNAGTARVAVLPVGIK